MAYSDYLDHSEDYSLDQFFVILSDNDNDNDNVNDKIQEPQLSDYTSMRSDRDLSCRMCKLTFNSEHEKELHSKIHRIRHPCHYCPNYTSTTEKSDLIEHLKAEHADMDFFFCEHCLYFIEGYYKKAFKNHQKSHAFTPYSCPYLDCEFTSRRKYDLGRHLKKMHKDKEEKQEYDNKYHKEERPSKKMKSED